MGQKSNPIGLRLQINRTWDSRWFAEGQDYGRLLLEDLKIRQFIFTNRIEAWIAVGGANCIRDDLFSQRVFDRIDCADAAAQIACARLDRDEASGASSQVGNVLRSQRVTVRARDPLPFVGWRSRQRCSRAGRAA